MNKEELLEKFKCISFIPKGDRNRIFLKLHFKYNIPVEEIKKLYYQSRENKIFELHNKKFFLNNKEYCVTKTITQMGQYYPFWYSLAVKRDDFYFNLFSKKYEEVDLSDYHQSLINYLIKTDFLKLVYNDQYGEIFTPEGLDFKQIVNGTDLHQ